MCPRYSVRLRAPPLADRSLPPHMGPVETSISGAARPPQPRDPPASSRTSGADLGASWDFLPPVGGLWPPGWGSHGSLPNTPPQYHQHRAERYWGGSAHYAEPTAQSALRSGVLGRRRQRHGRHARPTRPPTHTPSPPDIAPAAAMRGLQPLFSGCGCATYLRFRFRPTQPPGRPGTRGSLETPYSPDSSRSGLLRRCPFSVPLL